MTASASLVGAWRLISWEERLPDGTVRHPFSRSVVGSLVYTADGHVSAQLMDPERRQGLPCSSPAGLGEADRARAYDTYMAYCGTYTVEGNVVTHHVEAGLDPALVGTGLVRPFTLEGGRLIIHPGAHTLTWERTSPPC